MDNLDLNIISNVDRNILEFEEDLKIYKVRRKGIIFIMSMSVVAMGLLIFSGIWDNRNLKVLDIIGVSLLVCNFHSSLFQLVEIDSKIRKTQFNIDYSKQFLESIKNPA